MNRCTEAAGHFGTEERENECLKVQNELWAG
jgi:hypothetical protein